MNTPRQSLRWLKRTDIEKCFTNLATGFAIGVLSSHEYAAALKVFKFRDDGNHYWSIGSASGEWYMHDGARWHRAAPPEEMLGPDLPLLPAAPAKSAPQTGAPRHAPPIGNPAGPAARPEPPPRAARPAAPRPEPTIEPPRAKFCGQCGGSIAPGKRFCTQCGANAG